MALTRDLIQQLAPGTVIAKAAQSVFGVDEFMNSLVLKPDGGSNGTNANMTVSWIDYNEQVDAEDRDYGGEYTADNAIPDPKMITLREVGKRYDIDLMMHDGISNDGVDVYEGEQVIRSTYTVKKGIARRFLFGAGTGKLIKGLSAWADTFAQVLPYSIDLSGGTQLMTLDKAQKLVAGFNDGRAKMNVQANVLYCSRDDLALFETAQMLLGLYTTKIIYEDINYAQFGGIKIASLDFTDFNYNVAGVGGEFGSVFFLARMDENDGVYGVIPRNGKILNVTLASEQKTGKRNLEGNVFTLTNILPFNKRGFVKVKIKKGVNA